MPRKKGNQNRKKKKKGKATSISSLGQGQQRQQAVTTKLNFLPEAGPGCHIVRFPESESKFESKSESSCNTEILGWDDDILEEDFEGQSVPDLALDPSDDGTSSTLTLCNVSHVTKVAYITVYDVECFGKNGKKFTSGTTTDNQGNRTSDVVTFIVLAPPMTFCTLCEMVARSGSGSGSDQCITSVRIESDVQDWNPHPDPNLELGTPLKGFPLEESETCDSFLCTQGVNGQLTHYFWGNLHAVDFRCDVGTPLLAVEDGEVVEVRDGNILTGICASNMFQWNSILIRHRHKHKTNIIHETGGSMKDDNDEEGQGPNYFFTEYVHIQSATVQKGDQVQCGDMIGYSGSVGFSPEPHLHFAVYLSGEADAPSVGFWFQGRRQASVDADNVNGDVEYMPYRPIAGRWYNSYGPKL